MRDGGETSTMGENGLSSGSAKGSSEMRCGECPRGYILSRDSSGFEAAGAGLGRWPCGLEYLRAGKTGAEGMERDRTIGNDGWEYWRWWEPPIGLIE